MNIISGEEFQNLTEVSFFTVSNCIIEDQLAHKRQKLLRIADTSIEEVKQYKTIFIYTHFVHDFMNKFLSYLQPGTTIVTHNSDDGINEQYLKYLESSNIKKWFCQNRYVNHPKLYSLPIGIANSQWPHGNQQLISNIRSENNIKNNLVFKNFDSGTNLSKRNICDQITSKNGIFMWVKKPNDEYWRDISKSYFTICPHGNGVDSHRIWECLYLRSVPIVEEHECFRQFVHLPIIFCKDWNNITVEFLNRQVDKYNKVNWNVDDLYIENWKRHFTDLD